MFKVDDRVKLSSRHAANFTSRSGGTDWVKRRGVVKRLSKCRSVFVLWDGRTSLDQWPIEALVKVCDDSDC